MENTAAATITISEALAAATPDELYATRDDITEHSDSLDDIATVANFADDADKHPRLTVLTDDTPAGIDLWGKGYQAAGLDRLTVREALIIIDQVIRELDGPDA